MIVAIHLCDMPASDPLGIVRRQRLYTAVSFDQAENGIAVNARQSFALLVGKQFIRLKSGYELALPGSDRRLKQERIGHQLEGMAMPRFVEMELAWRAARRQRDQQAFFGRRQQQRRFIAHEEPARRAIRRAKSALLCQVVAKQIEVRAIGRVRAAQKIDREQHVGQLARCALAATCTATKACGRSKSWAVRTCAAGAVTRTYRKVSLASTSPTRRGCGHARMPAASANARSALSSPTNKQRCGEAASPASSPAFVKMRGESLVRPMSCE